MVDKPAIPATVMPVKTYPYRWLIVALYGLYAGANLFQINQFTIIENIIEKYYQTSSFLVNLSQLVFTITLVIFIVPSVYIIEKFNLRVVAIISSGLTFLGAILKVFALDPNPSQFHIIIIGQAICGVAQVFFIMLPAKVVAVWCSAEEQNFACGISLWGGEIGMLLGAVIPIKFMQNRSSDQIGDGVFWMLITNAIFCGIVFVAILIFFKAKPKIPPSAQQFALVDTKIDYRSAFRELRNNKDFLLITTLFGISCGLWGVFGIIMNMVYLHYFPDSLQDLASLSAIITASGGMVGNVLFGYILDKTLKYKLITFLSLLCTTVSYGVLAVCFEMKLYTASYITMIIYGFFCSSSVIISFQYIAEVTYPISEAVTVSSLQVMLSLVTIVYEVFFNILLDNNQFVTVHVVTFSTFCVVTGCTYFLSSKLKRMLVDTNVNKIT